MADRPVRAQLPLLTWPEDRTLNLLEAARLDLRRRIARLKPRSHARIVLEAELRLLTSRALERRETAPPTP